MKMSLLVECDCGNMATIPLKKTFVEYEGKVYEDYSSIQEGVEENDLFTADQGHPDVVTITCKTCGKEHELTT